MTHLGYDTYVFVGFYLKLSNPKQKTKIKEIYVDCSCGKLSQDGSYCSKCGKELEKQFVETIDYPQFPNGFLELEGDKNLLPIMIDKSYIDFEPNSEIGVMCDFDDMESTKRKYYAEILRRYDDFFEKLNSYFDWEVNFGVISYYM
jgi:ribosomal protein L32